MHVPALLPAAPTTCTLHGCQPRRAAAPRCAVAGAAPGGRALKSTWRLMPLQPVHVRSLPCREGYDMLIDKDVVLQASSSSLLSF